MWGGVSNEGAWSRHPHARVISFRRLSVNGWAESLPGDRGVVRARATGLRSLTSARAATPDTRACPRRRPIALPGSPLVGHRLKSTVLLLLLILNISRVLVRQFTEFLRPVVDARLWLVLRAFVIDLGLEHSFILVGYSALKSKFLRRLNRILPILEEIQELLVNREHLVVIQTVWLPIDQALDCGQLLENEDVLVVLVQVDVRQVGVQQVLVQLSVDVRRLLQIHDGTQNFEKILGDFIRLLRHDSPL